MSRREREVVDAFRSAGATGPSGARTLDELQLGDSRTVRRLRRRAVLREAAPERYWLDAPSWEALRATRRRMVFVILGAVLLVLITALIVSRG